MKISIIIPVYNEEKYILTVLNSVNKEKSKHNLEIIVVDDNSTDNTKKIIEENSHLYDQVIFKKLNQGKGSAIRSAISKVTGDYVLIQDADFEYSPSDYGKLFEPIKSRKMTSEELEENKFNNDIVKALIPLAMYLKMNAKKD